MPTRFFGRFTSPVLDHFHHPRNVGLATGYNRYWLEQDNAWHIRLLFTLRVEQGRILEVKFKAQSCVTTVACASALTEMAQGKDVATALAIRPEQLSETLGTVPHEKMYCCQLVIATLRLALESPVQTDSHLHSSQG